MAKVTVRTERAGDADAIRRLHRAAFEGPVEAGIVDALRGTDRWIDGGSLVATDPDGTVVGHLLLSKGDLLGEDNGLVRRIWMLGPIGVLPARQGSGVGGALMRASIALAKRRGEPVICLLGHASYYPRFGFEPARAIGIEPPRPWPDANWMALRLPAWSADLRGTARYPPAFPD